MHIEELPDPFKKDRLTRDPLGIAPIWPIPPSWRERQGAGADPWKSPGICPPPFPWASPVDPFIPPERSAGEMSRARRDQQERSEKWARGAEEAQSALGARHFFRETLSKGSMEDVYRVFGILIERGFEKEALEKGKSETLSAAALGAQPERALGFLHEKGFRVSFELAQMALLAALAKAANPRDSGGAEKRLALASARSLIELFDAGADLAEALGQIKAIDPQLEARARVNQERWEIARAAGGSGPKPSKAPLRI